MLIVFSLDKIEVTEQEGVAQQRHTLDVLDLALLGRVRLTRREAHVHYLEGECLRPRAWGEGDRQQVASCVVAESARCGVGDVKSFVVATINYNRYPGAPCRPRRVSDATVRESATKRPMIIGE